MTTRVSFVVSIGRMGMNDEPARTVIEQAVGKFGGKVLGGVGSATDPIIAEFVEKAPAVEAAKELYFHDSIEAATVHDADNLATGTIKEGLAEGTVDPVLAAISGLAVNEVVDGLLAAAKAGKLPKPVEEAGGAAEADEMPRIAALAEAMEKIVADFSGLKNDTATVFVEDAKANADALRKILACAPAK